MNPLRGPRPFANTKSDFARLRRSDLSGAAGDCVALVGTAVTDTLHLGRAVLVGRPTWPPVLPIRDSLEQAGASRPGQIEVDHPLDLGIVGAARFVAQGAAALGTYAVATLVGVLVGLAAVTLRLGSFAAGYWAASSRCISLLAAPILLARDLAAVVHALLWTSAATVATVPALLGRGLGNAVTLVLDPLRPEVVVPVTQPLCRALG